MVKGYIINIQKDKKTNSSLVTVMFGEVVNGQTKYNTQIVTEESVIDAVQSARVELDNAKVEGGELKGTTGSLTRFEQEEKPVVIMAEIKHRDGKLIGYEVVSATGVVRRIRTSELLSYADRKTNAGYIPFQNGIYIRDNAERKAHIKSFKADGFNVKLVGTSQNTHSTPAKVDIPSNERKMDKLQELFTKEQQIELAKGKKNGVDIRIYGNNKLSAEQMRVIREGLQDGLQASLIADPAFSVNSMKMYLEEMRFGFDVTGYLNPKYSAEQIMEVSLGLAEGVDVSVYADPSNTPERMAETRLRLTHDIWKEEHAMPNGKWI